jgi:hypothetical protein
MAYGHFTLTPVPVRKALATALKGWKFAGWEGGLAPAQDRMPFSYFRESSDEPRGQI